MPLYQVSATYFFRETGQRLEPNDTVELSEVSYQKYRISHPGLLRPAMMTTQARPAQIRSEEPAEPVTVPVMEEAVVAEPEKAPQTETVAPATEPVQQEAVKVDETPAPVEAAQPAPEAENADAKPKAKSRAKKA